MTGSLRERRKLMLRDEILHAAQALVAEKGYTAMSMDELAAQVGISKPTLYSFFATKEDLVVAATMQRMEQVTAILDADSPEQTPLQRLTLLLHTIIQLQVDDGTMALRPWTPELFQLLCAREDALNTLRGIDEAIVALVQQGIAQGEIAEDLDPATVVRGFYTLVGALNFARFSVGGQPDPARVAGSLAALFERGVRRQA